MRDLRAELRDWNDEDPIEWQPDDGYILVGFLREPLPDEDDSLEDKQVIIDEERTGIAVAVNLDSPVLAGLFGLHNPRVHDRIGLKCTGVGDDGVRRFVMVVDRDSTCVPNDPEDLAGATSEERDYIEDMLAQGSSPESPDPQPSPVIGFARDLPIKAKSVGALTLGLLMLFLGGLLAFCPHWLISLFR